MRGVGSTADNNEETGEANDDFQNEQSVLICLLDVSHFLIKSFIISLDFT